MTEEFLTHEFDSGLVLVAQRMPQVSSAAMTIALPAGASRDPADAAGAAAVSCFWLLRGAGGRDTRRLNEALDSLGCQHHEGAQGAHLLLSAAQLGRNLPEALAIYADIIRDPHFGEETFGSCRELVSQALDGLEDEPMRKCNILIREKFYPSPLGRNPYGTKESLLALRPGVLRQHLKHHLTPHGAIVAVAGNLDLTRLVDLIGQHLGTWQGVELSEVLTTEPEGGVTHLNKPTAQAQIALAYPAATTKDQRYYAARVAENVLSGGMSARLLAEVREKRGLVYAVAARYHSLKHHAGVFVYAGTTPERAQETLVATVGELRRLEEGIGQDELARARVQLKSALIMRGESSSDRAHALAADWYHLGRLRSLAEISAAIDNVTLADVIDYVRAYPARRLTALTIGPEELDTAILH